MLGEAFNSRRTRPLSRAPIAHRAFMILPVIVVLAAGYVASSLGTSQPAATQVPPQDSLTAFERIAAVLQSPRCLNCHPRGDRPTQGDDRHVHLMNVQRGAEGKGLPAMLCTTCHQGRNNDAAGVPGAPHWHLAPRSMGWTGLSIAELCRTILDPTKNGGRSVADLVAHMTTDKLVLWAWQPGRGRSPPPVSPQDLKAALDLWAMGGAPCPN
jgi:hypothetical protein